MFTSRNTFLTLLWAVIPLALPLAMSCTQLVISLLSYSFLAAGVLSNLSPSFFVASARFPRFGIRVRCFCPE